MNEIQAFSVFCDSSRQEIGNLDSLVGILPDGMLINSVPATVPRLTIVTRIRVATQFFVTSAWTTLVRPGEFRETMNNVDPTLFASARNAALQRSFPYYTVVTRDVFSPFIVGVAGQYKVEINTNFGTQMTGFIEISTQAWQ